LRPPAAPEGAAVLVELAIGMVVVGAVLVLGTLLSGTRPSEPVPDLEGYYDRWRDLHGGHDPRASVWVRGWLRLTYRLSRPLAVLGVKPDLLTLWTVWISALALIPAAIGGPWAILAGLIVVLSAVGDTLDGAVAALTDRATRFGYVLDSLVDRVNEVLFLGAVVLVGGLPVLAVIAGGLFLLHDYLRARAAGAGAGEVATVTLGERANRVIILALSLGLAGAVPMLQATIATLGLAIMILLMAAGLGQLLVAIRALLTTHDAT